MDREEKTESRIRIASLTRLEYYLLFAEHRSALTDQYAGESARYSLLLGASLDGIRAGYLCAVPDGQCLRIAYVFTLPEYRKKGICTALLRFVVDRTDVSLRINITSDHESHDTIVAMARELGFTQTEGLRVFLCERKDLPAWKAFMERKGQRLCDTLTRRGYETCSFADAKEDLLTQLKRSPRSPYANPLDPAPFLMTPERKLSPAMSYVCAKDGLLAAYTLVTQVSPAKVIYEHISDSALERGTGCILLPFAGSMEAFEESGCETVSYAMYDSNTHAGAFREKLLNVLNASSVSSENYMLIREQKAKS